jgi:hypothetical protein
MAETLRPRRRHQLTIIIDGDTIEAVQSALERILFDFDVRRNCPAVSGGYASGWIAYLTEDPEMTHEKYFEAVNQYLEKEKEKDKDKGREAGADG